MDPLDLLCYTASTCPLPVFNLWPNTTFCPMCVQLICLNCSTTNRSNCLSCGPSSTLSNGACACNSGYWEKKTLISSANNGQWNSKWSSLTNCFENCTNHIANCEWDKCNSFTLCTVCMAGYIPDRINSTHQNCKLCSSVLSNCIKCI